MDRNRLVQPVKANHVALFCSHGVGHIVYLRRVVLQIAYVAQQPARADVHVILAGTVHGNRMRLPFLHLADPALLLHKGVQLVQCIGRASSKRFALGARFQQAALDHVVQSGKELLCDLLHLVQPFSVQNIIHIIFVKAKESGKANEDQRNKSPYAPCQPDTVLIMHSHYLPANALYFQSISFAEKVSNRLKYSFAASIPTMPES